ncbi:Thioredoxin domain protein [Geobacter metallireducens RCH3]|nr:Thioredoxin domain protein [Geobacter metallireducens RCH3]
MVREIARELAGRGVVAQVNTQGNPQVASRFGIRGIPALVLLQRGKILGSLNGAQSKESVLSWVRSTLR